MQKHIRDWTKCPFKPLTATLCERPVPRYHFHALIKPNPASRAGLDFQGADSVGSIALNPAVWLCAEHRCLKRKVTYRSTWGFPLSVRWWVGGGCQGWWAACAANHLVHSRRWCPPSAGRLAAAPPIGWWSRARASQYCYTHLKKERRKIGWVSSIFFN